MRIIYLFSFSSRLRLPQSLERQIIFSIIPPPPPSKIPFMTEETPNRFRHPITNQRYLKGLFFEKVDSDKSTVLYTLKDVPHEGFPSFYQLYMAIDDPTEWEVSQQLTDGWEHWEMLCNCSWFKPFVERWRKELQLRMMSQALVRIKSEAKTGSKESFGANKYLLEKGWEPKERTTARGRPSKEEIKKAADDLVRSDNQLSKDYERLGLLN